MTDLLKTDQTHNINDMLSKIKEERNQIADRFIKNKIDQNQSINDRFNIKSFKPFTYDLELFKQKYCKEGRDYYKHFVIIIDIGSTLTNEKLLDIIFCSPLKFPNEVNRLKSRFKSKTISS